MSTWSQGLRVFSLTATVGLASSALAQQEPASVGPAAAELARMQRHLEQHYSPADVTHRFRTELGDDIDCVRMERQPGLRRAGMEGHRLQLAPSTEPQREPAQMLVSMPSQGLGQGVDAQGNMQHCPQGSIPILRTTLDDMRRFNSLEAYFRKVPGSAPIRRPSTELPAIQPPLAGPTSTHQYAHGYLGVANRGATSTFNLWNPYVELNSEFSLSQIWVVRGSGSYLETVEVGIQLYPQLYGDRNSRLFIYYTPDNYTTGCYNLTCSAFVQTNSSIVIGGLFSAYSVSGGTQQEVPIEWFKDGTAGNWWLRVNGTWLGYYPRSLFDANGLIDGGASVDFGGEIIDNRPSGRHTGTDMGSGAYSSAGWQRAAYQRRIQYTDTTNVYRAPSLTLSVSSSYCYDIAQFLDSTAGGWGRYFYFGGPGYNTNCT